MAAKLLTLVGLVYVVSPLDLLPDWIVGLGWLDDVAIMALALINLVKSAPAEVVREHQRDIVGPKKP